MEIQGLPQIPNKSQIVKSLYETILNGLYIQCEELISKSFEEIKRIESGDMNLESALAYRDIIILFKEKNRDYILASISSLLLREDRNVTSNKLNAKTVEFINSMLKKYPQIYCVEILKTLEDQESILKIYPEFKEEIENGIVCREAENMRNKKLD